MHPFWETTLSRETVREQPCEFITPDNTPNVSEIMTRSLRNIYWRKKPFGNTNFWGVNRCTQLLVMGEGWSIAQSLYNWTQKKKFSKVRHKTVCRELMPAVLDSSRPLKLECLEMKNSTSVHPTQEVWTHIVQNFHNKKPLVWQSQPGVKAAISNNIVYYWYCCYYNSYQY